MLNTTLIPCRECQKLGRWTPAPDGICDGHRQPHIFQNKRVSPRKGRKTIYLLEGHGRNLFFYRLRSGLTREEVARKIRVTPERLTLYEENKKRPTIPQCRVMCDAYDCGLAYFLIAPDNITARMMLWAKFTYVKKRIQKRSNSKKRAS